MAKFGLQSSPVLLKIVNKGRARDIHYFMYRGVNYDSETINRFNWKFSKAIG